MRVIQLFSMLTLWCLSVGKCLDGAWGIGVNMIARVVNQSFHAAVQEVVSAAFAWIVAHIGRLFESRLVAHGRMDDVLLDLVAYGTRLRSRRRPMRRR